MTVAQPALETTPMTAFGAVVARQLSMWPFASRTARLFLLVDPSLPDTSLRRGVLRAMQQAYFASDGHSQTRAVRESALAAHYVLRHHNRDVLPLDQINAASAVAALRGNVAIVALAGHAAAFAWRDGQLTGQRGMLRLPRPLGLQQDPAITLWSTRLSASDRLVLVSGLASNPGAAETIGDVLSSAPSTAEAEQRLADCLGDARPAGVLVIGSRDEKPTSHLRLLAPSDASHADATPISTAPRRPHPTLRRWLTFVFGVVLLAAVSAAAFTIAPDATRLAADANLQVVPAPESTYRVDAITPRMAVRLGPSAANVVDLAVGNDALYTLDVAEASVRVFALDGLGQQPTTSTLLATAGMPVDALGHHLGTPVAIEYLDQPGALAIIDQDRSVVEVGADRSLTLRTVPTSTGWQQLGALGSDPAGHLLFLDSGARQILEYPALSDQTLDPPRLLVDGSLAPRVPLERIAELVGVEVGVGVGVGESDSLVARFDDGSVQRLDTSAVAQPVGIASSITSIATDRGSGLYLADPANQRILHTALDGTILQELRDPALGDVRDIETSLDGRRLFGIVASGVLVFDIPEV
jgi:hypothetical protein